MNIAKCFSKQKYLNSENDTAKNDNSGWDKIYENLKIFLFIMIALLLFAQIIIFANVNKKNEVIHDIINKINNSSHLNITKK